MVTNREKSLSRAARWGWGLLVTLSALLALNGLGLYFFIADSHLMRTVSLMEIGLGLLALVVAWEGFRQGARWAWRAIWVLVALLAVLGLHILLEGDMGISMWYLSLAAVALLGQLLAGRGFTLLSGK
jgi:hypothetical protein